MMAKRRERKNKDLADVEMVNRIGPCDVTSKNDLSSLVNEISKREKHVNLLSAFAPFFLVDNG